MRMSIGGQYSVFLARTGMSSKFISRALSKGVAWLWWLQKDLDINTKQSRNQYLARMG